MLKKNWIPALTILTLLVTLTGCTCNKEPIESPELGETAKLEITFNPNPVSYKNKSWSWEVTLTELNGIGVNLTSLNRESHNAFRIVNLNSDKLAIKKWLGSDYLPPYGHLTSNREWPREEGPYILVESYEVLTFMGTDDNGYEVQVTGRVDLLPP